MVTDHTSVRNAKTFGKYFDNKPSVQMKHVSSLIEKKLT